MKAGEKQYMSAFALNEWDSKLAGGVEWRQKIDTQVRGVQQYVFSCTVGGGTGSRCLHLGINFGLFAAGE